MMKDRDSVYGLSFQQQIKNTGIKEVLTAPGSPWQNAYAERIIGSIRRECLNHLIVLNGRHLRRILTPYFNYYNHDRTHYGLGKVTPIERYIQKKPPVTGKIA
jgi:transposase InsO family protein